MHIQSHKVNLTPGEVEIIGDALCAEVERSAKSFKEKEITMKDFEVLHQPEIDLLRDLTQVGYSIYIQGDDVLDGKFTTDTNEWIESLKVV